MRSRDMFCPRFARNSPALSSRGRREDQVRAAPAVSCAMTDRKCAHEHTGSAEASRPSLRNGFTAYLVLFPERTALLPPSPASKLSLLADLTPALRRQNHTTSPYASGAHRLSRLPRPSHPTAHSDDRERPSCCGGDGRSYAGDLGSMLSGIFSRAGLDVISENRK